MDKAYKIHMGKADCALDLGDGSERGEYVNQDYILHKMGRPHRNISLMYTYYPNDKEWPQRISKACADMDIKFQWDFPYDDYFPYGGGPKGNTEGEPFTYMKDIRMHGQDVTLTITMDCSVTEDHLRTIAKELKPFGRLRLRINHECAGSWFTHSKRFSYQEVADFFVKFHKIIKEEAPNIQTIFCAGMVNPETGLLEYEKEFTEAYKCADIWSTDCYLALHFGWPYNVCEKDAEGWTNTSVDECFNRFKNMSERLKIVNNGTLKPIIAAEMNTDGDVTGPQKQGDSQVKFLHKIQKEKASWFTSVTMYQFRDRGRLGLEIQDPNNETVGIEQPMLKQYKKVLHEPYFMPKMQISDEISFPVQMRWGCSEDADGIAIPLVLEKNPVFFEITVEDPISLMIEINDHWFYKAPQTKTIDLMSAFFESPVKRNAKLNLKIFATPVTGKNVQTEKEDWTTNYYTELKEMPKLRIRYTSVNDVK